MGSLSPEDWIRHECQLGYQSAADLVCVGLEMDSLADSVAAVEESEIGRGRWPRRTCWRRRGRSA
jgi:hypothetical protein